MRISDWSSDVCSSDLRFPGVRLLDDWPDEAMAALAPDHRSAVVVLTHDPKLDDPALRVALHSPAFYVGALGSRKTHAKRLARLSDEGLNADDLARIHAPIGLAIGARSPAEIAIARSDDHTSEPQALMRISYAVFCLKKKQNTCQTSTKC